MIFNSVSFLVFFPIVTLIYFAIPKRVKYIWLLVASYYFYMCWNATYALLIAASTLITYLCALGVDRMQSDAKRKLCVAGGLVSNLGILFFFKYFDFALANLNKVLGLLNIQLLENPFDILLPVGISFYTFQALGYMIDVYRKEIPAERNLLKYALFVSFFPQLVAGPIERSKNLFEQIKKMDQKFLSSFESVSRGFAMMMWGLFMKMVIADRIAIFVDTIFANTVTIGTVEGVLGAFAFAIQIYCDFGGYSAIAIGAAKVMGFELMENFNAPYLALSIPEFWRRWHISLSTWFRDYVYIPLGGNRVSRVRKYFNLMVTFLVSGLWHGAAWTYVIWGGIHGMYQVVGDLIKPIRNKLIDTFGVRVDTFGYRFFQVVKTFCLTSFAWIFFRASSISQALLYIKRTFTYFNPWVLFDHTLELFGLNAQEISILFWALLILVAVDLLRRVKGITLGEFLIKQPMLFRWLVLIGLVLATIVYGEYGINFDSKQFIYFAF